MIKHKPTKREQDRVVKLALIVRAALKHNNRIVGRKFYRICEEVDRTKLLVTV